MAARKGARPSQAGSALVELTGPRWFGNTGAEEEQEEQQEDGRLGSSGDGGTGPPRQEAGDSPKAKKPKKTNPQGEEDSGDMVCWPCGSGEATSVRPLRNPEQPTATEIAEHNLTHLPPRSWCPHCVRGRGKSLAHKQRDKER